MNNQDIISIIAIIINIIGIIILPIIFNLIKQTKSTSKENEKLTKKLDKHMKIHELKNTIGYQQFYIISAQLQQEKLVSGFHDDTLRFDEKDYQRLDNVIKEAENQIEICQKELEEIKNQND